MKPIAAKAFSASLLVAALGGCGGGGGDAGLSSSDSFAVGTAYTALLTATKSWTTTGKGSDGYTYTATVAIQPLADGVFALDGKTYARTRQTLTLSPTLGTSPVATPTITDTYFSAATDLPVGTFSADTKACSRVTAANALPATATVGASGPQSTETELSSCTASAASQGITTTTWSLTSASPPSGSAFALLCQNAAITSTGSAPSGTAAYCVEITANGSLGSRARLSINIPNVLTLTATNY